MQMPRRIAERSLKEEKEEIFIRQNLHVYKSSGTHLRPWKALRAHVVFLEFFFIIAMVGNEATAIRPLHRSHERRDTLVQIMLNFLMNGLTERRGFASRSTWLLQRSVRSQSVVCPRSIAAGRLPRWLHQTSRVVASGALRLSRTGLWLFT